MTHTDRVDVLPLTTQGFALSGLKTWSAMEGTGYQFTLTHNRKRVAQVTNDGTGGETRILWKGLYPNGKKDPRATKAAFEASVQAKEAFEAFLAATPEVELNGHAYKPDAGWVLEELLNHHNLVKACRTSTLFRTTDGQELTVRERFNPGVAAWIRANYPGATIYNEQLAA